VIAVALARPGVQNGLNATPKFYVDGARVDVIDDGQAALIVVGESTIQAAIEKAQLKAEKQVAKELDVKPKVIDKAIEEAATELK